MHIPLVFEYNPTILPLFELIERQDHLEMILPQMFLNSPLFQLIDKIIWITNNFFLKGAYNNNK